MRTYVNIGLLDYVDKRYSSQSLLRTAVIPFDVPETFARSGNKSGHFGRELAQLFQRELLKSGELGIIELFDRDRWPGKRADFFAGNHQAIKFASSAGYDLLIVGYMEEITNESDLVFFTRVIDLSNAVTVWYSKTLVYSTIRERQRQISRIPLVGNVQEPSRFEFPARAQLFASCTVERILNDLVISGDEPAEQEPKKKRRATRPPK